MWKEPGVVDKVLRGSVAALAMLCGACGAGEPTGVEETESSLNSLGVYGLTSRYTGPVMLTRGWEIEWEVPQLTSSPTSTGAIGQWYYGLESGIYHTGDGWWVYYYGDDNGLTGNNPECTPLGDWGNKGAACHGAMEHLQPGRRVVFRYEWCDVNHVPSVNGSRLCVSVDMKDGVGPRFLAEDTRGTEEMYAHDIEDFSDGPQEPIRVSCSAPIKMVRQQYKDPSGFWWTMFGKYTWSLNDTTALHTFQNDRREFPPGTWEACSQ